MSGARTRCKRFDCFSLRGEADLRSAHTGELAHSNSLRIRHTEHVTAHLSTCISTTDTVDWALLSRRVLPARVGEHVANVYSRQGTTIRVE